MFFLNLRESVNLSKAFIAYEFYIRPDVFRYSSLEKIFEIVSIGCPWCGDSAHRGGFCYLWGCCPP